MSSKLREVLVEVESILSTWIDHLPPVVQEEAQEALNKAEAVINEPLRNCDIGTVAEQKERFDKYCFSRKCNKCPVYFQNQGSVDCGLWWAQMPYVGS